MGMQAELLLRDSLGPPHNFTPKAAEVQVVGDLRRLTVTRNGAVLEGSVQSREKKDVITRKSHHWKSKGVTVSRSVLAGRHLYGLEVAWREGKIKVVDDARNN